MDYFVTHLAFQYFNTKSRVTVGSGGWGGGGCGPRLSLTLDRWRVTTCNHPRTTCKNRGLVRKAMQCNKQRSNIPDQSTYLNSRGEQTQQSRNLLKLDFFSDCARHSRYGLNILFCDKLPLSLNVQHVYWIKCHVLKLSSQAKHQLSLV